MVRLKNLFHTRWAFVMGRSVLSQHLSSSHAIIHSSILLPFFPPTSDLRFLTSDFCSPLHALRSMLYAQVLSYRPQLSALLSCPSLPRRSGRSYWGCISFLSGCVSPAAPFLTTPFQGALPFSSSNRDLCITPIFAQFWSLRGAKRRGPPKHSGGWLINVL